MTKVAWFALSLMALLPGNAFGQCVDTLWGGADTGMNFVSGVGNPLTNAVDAWTGACGSQAPPLSNSSSPVSGLLNIDVFHLANGTPCDGVDACACSTREADEWGNTTGGNISVYDYSSEGYDCRARLEANLAHEIGHFLGFADVRDSSCVNNIMYFEALSTATGISMEQCDVIDEMWTIHDEDPCDNPQPPQGCDNGQDSSPIVIDLERNGFLFTSAAAGVDFDIDSDGVPESIAWVGDSQDAFLVRDLNGNGIVDDGGELFGNYTVLIDGSRANHGFEALAELDLLSQAGNG